jgi:hypothetical protein
VAGTHTEQEAAAVLARAAQELTRLSELAADSREDALAAMSETLTREPQARPLGEALQRSDGPAAGAALRTLADRADELSDEQRQTLARALQRAANLGRGDPRSAEALQAAARALSDANSSDANTQAGPALQAAAAAVEAAVEVANAQAGLRSAAQPPPAAGAEPGQAGMEPGQAGAEPGRAGGQAAADLPSQPPSAFAVPEASENVVVPGRPSDALEAGDVVQQPLSVRGQPRPYREVLAQYAQSGRDYVERASVPPHVRELVKQYFVDLQEP